MIKPQLAGLISYICALQTLLAAGPAGKMTQRDFTKGDRIPELSLIHI